MQLCNQMNVPDLSIILFLHGEVERWLITSILRIPLSSCFQVDLVLFVMLLLSLCFSSKKEWPIFSITDFHKRGNGPCEFWPDAKNVRQCIVSTLRVSLYQLVKPLATKADDLSVMPTTYILEGENQPLHVVL